MCACKYANFYSNISSFHFYPFQNKDFWQHMKTNSASLENILDVVVLLGEIGWQMTICFYSGFHQNHPSIKTFVLNTHWSLPVLLCSRFLQFLVLSHMGTCPRKILPPFILSQRWTKNNQGKTVKSICISFFSVDVLNIRLKHLKEGRGYFASQDQSYGLSWWISHSSRNLGQWSHGIRSQEAEGNEVLSLTSFSLLYHARTQVQGIVPATVGGSSYLG